MYGNPSVGNQPGGYMPDFGAQNQFGRQQPTQPFQPQPQPQGNGQVSFRCLPVLSRDEAVQAAIDPLSPGLIMPNLGQGMIYLKRFNAQKGEAEFLDFAYVPPPAPAQPYDPQAEISAMRADMATLQASVMALCGELEKNKKAGAKTTVGKAAEQ